jgi:hypothetical protein
MFFFFAFRLGGPFLGITPGLGKVVVVFRTAFPTQYIVTLHPEPI